MSSNGSRTKFKKFAVKYKWALIIVGFFTWPLGRGYANPYPVTEYKTECYLINNTGIILNLYEVCFPNKRSEESQFNPNNKIVNSATQLPSDYVLKTFQKCPFTVEDLINKTNAEYGLNSESVDAIAISIYGGNWYLAGTNRAGTATCTRLGNSIDSTYDVVTTIDSNFSTEHYSVDCDKYTIAPVQLELGTPDQRSRGEQAYTVGKSRVVDKGTIGDGILTNYCQAYWDSKK